MVFQKFRNLRVRIVAAVPQVAQRQAARRAPLTPNSAGQLWLILVARGLRMLQKLFVSF